MRHHPLPRLVVFCLLGYKISPFEARIAFGLRRYFDRRYVFLNFNKFALHFVNHPLNDILSQGISVLNLDSRPAFFGFAVQLRVKNLIVGRGAGNASLEAPFTPIVHDGLPIVGADLTFL